MEDREWLEEELTMEDKEYVVSLMNDYETGKIPFREDEYNNIGSECTIALTLWSRKKGFKSEWPLFKFISSPEIDEVRTRLGIEIPNRRSSKENNGG